MVRPDGQGVTLQETTEEKDLGVWADSTVKQTTQAALAVKKANQLLGLIRQYTCTNCDLMRRLGMYRISGRFSLCGTG